MNRSVAKNAIYNMAYQGLNILFPLITTAYVSRILLPSGVGQINFATNIASYFTLFASLGLPMYGVREIAKVREERVRLNQVFTELITANLLSTIVFSVLYFLVILAVPMSYAQRTLFSVVGISVILNVINVDWFYQGVEDYGYITTRSMLVKTASLVLIFCLVRSSKDITFYALIQVLILSGNYIPNVIHLRKYIRLDFSTIRSVFGRLRPLVVFLGSSLAIEIYTMSDTTMLGIMCSKAVVGYYTNSIKLVRLVTQLISASTMVLLPRLSLIYKQGKMAEYNKLLGLAGRVLFIFTIPSVVGLCLLADPIVKILFGDSFLPAVLTIRILSFTILITAFATLIGSNVLITIGKAQFRLYSTMAAAMLNVLLNFMLIPLWQQNGSSIASVASEFVNLIVMYWFARKYIHSTMDVRFVIRIVTATCVMTLGVLSWIQFMHISDLFKLIGGVSIGILLYIGTCLILREKTMLNLISRIIGRATTRH